MPSTFTPSCRPHDQERSCTPCFLDDDRRNGGGREISLGKVTELHDVTVTSTPVVRTTIGLHRTRPADPRRELHWCFTVFGSSLHLRLPLDSPRGASPLPISVGFPSSGSPADFHHLFCDHASRSTPWLSATALVPRSVAENHVGNAIVELNRFAVGVSQYY